MSSYRLISNAGSLPAPGVARESETLDFKGTYAPGDLDEMAKDIAAFANHMGGTILVGATEDADGSLLEYRPLPGPFADRLRVAFEQAAKELCSPCATIVPAMIPIDAGTVLAINVDPVTHTAMASRKKGSDGYIFPLRRATQTTFISPENLAMHMIPQLRRVIILLQRIEPETQVMLVYNPEAFISKPFVLKHVLPDLNHLVVSGSGGAKVVPLDHVESVWTDRGTTYIGLRYKRVLT